MRHIRFFLVIIISIICGVNVAKGEIVQNYTMNFNKSINTSAHDFKVASGWGHIVSFYHDNSYNQDYYVSYDYTSDGGRDGGALACGQQGELGGGYFADGTANDLLVTPKVKGKVSIYVKKYGYTATGIKFFKVTKDGDSFNVGDEIIPTAEPEISYSSWNKVELPELQEETYIGIRASSVYIDDFSAEQADVVKMPGLSILNVKNNGSDKPYCNVDGKFNVDFTATIENTGDLDLTSGMENYSLSVVNTKKDNAVMFTVPVNVNLAIGAKTEVAVKGEVDGNIYPDYNRYDVKENFDGATAFGAWLTPIPYKPILEVRGDNGKIDSGENFAFGMIRKNETKNFKLKNAGGAPLENLTISLPEGFMTNIREPITLGSDEEKTLEITADTSKPGTFKGNVVVSGKGIDNFNIAVSATILDAKKFYADFEDQKIPAGSYIEQNWNVEQRDYSSNENVYLLKNNRTCADDKFVTPLLKVSEGETLSFDACRVSSWSYGDDYYLNVYYSTDRQNWILARKIMSSEMSSENGSSSYNYQYCKLTNFTIDNIPAGNYYIGFGAGYICIDNIYGFEPVEVSHDVLLKDADFQKKGMVNYLYNAKATFQNLNSKPELSGSYVASLYFGGKVVATAEAAEIPAGDEATLNFSFMPHEVGTYEAYVTFENKADNLLISSNKVEVTIEEETLKSTLTVGAGSSKAANVFAYWYNADESNGANCDVIYPASMLAKYGLTSGAKIKSLTYKADTKEVYSDKTLENTTLEARVGLIDEDAFVPNEGYENLPVIKVYDNEAVTFKRTEDFVTTVTLPEPIVWDGASALRLFTKVKASSYTSVYYPCDDEVYKAYSYVNSLSSASKNPIVDIDLDTNPVTLSGKVTCNGVAVKDANVVLKSDEGVVYSAKTNEEGLYNMSVFQTGKKYKLYATAEDYYDYSSEEYISITEDKTLDIIIKSSKVVFSGKVTYRNNPVAGVKIALCHKGTDDIVTTSGEDGSYVFNKVGKGQNFLLKAVAEKYNDFTSADSIAVGDDDCVDNNIVLTKPLVKVSGKIVCGEMSVANANITLLADEKNIETKSDTEGNFLFEAEQDVLYNLVVRAERYEDYNSKEKLLFTEDTNLAAIELTAKFFTLIVPETNYMTFSSSKAVDLDIYGLTAYVVTDVKMKNDAAYTVLSQVKRIPANTGVVIYGPLGEYTIDYIDEADAIDRNLLVATSNEPFRSNGNDKGKVWILDLSDFKPVFTTGTDLWVSQGGAYLRYESKVENIYLYEKDVPETSSINIISDKEELNPALPMYNLAGQKVGADYKGIVLQNGKKFNVH